MIHCCPLFLKLAASLRFRLSFCGCFVIPFEIDFPPTGCRTVCPSFSAAINFCALSTTEQGLSIDNYEESFWRTSLSTALVLAERRQPRSEIVKHSCSQFRFGILFHFLSTFLCLCLRFSGQDEGFQRSEVRQVLPIALIGGDKLFQCCL